MKISLRYQGHTLTLRDCHLSWNTQRLREKVKEKLEALGQSGQDLTLTFNEVQLKDGETLEEAGLSDGCMIDVTSEETSGVTENEPSEQSDGEEEVNTQGATANEPSRQRMVNITVKKLSGEIFPMNVDLTWRQDFLKQEVSVLIDMDVGNLVLIHESKELKGDKTLRDANVKVGSIVLATGRFRGGGPNQWNM